MLYVDEKQSSSIKVQLDSSDIWLAFGVVKLWKLLFGAIWWFCFSIEFESALLRLPVPEISCQLPTDEEDSCRWRILFVFTGTDTGLVL